MRFVSLIRTFAAARTERQPADQRRPLGLADLEKDFDRTSDAFIDAAYFLERCLPRTFGI